MFRRQAKDKVYRKHFLQIEQQRNFLKAISTNLFIPVTQRKRALILLQRIANFKTHRSRNRCIETDRARSVIRVFRLNRMQIVQNAGFAKLAGVRKAS